MNDAIAGQDVLKSYGETNLQRLKKTKQEYDPNGFLSTRQKGFTLS